MRFARLFALVALTYAVLSWSSSALACGPYPYGC